MRMSVDRPDPPSDPGWKLYREALNMLDEHGEPIDNSLSGGAHIWCARALTQIVWRA